MRCATTDMLRRLLSFRSFRGGFLIVLFLLLPAFFILAFYQPAAPPFVLRHPYFQYDLDALEPREDDPQQLCVLPRIHPFDPSIWRFLAPPRPIVCKGRRDALTIIDDHGWLKFNESQLLDSGYEVDKTLWCSWSRVQRGGTSGNVDNVVSYGQKSPLPKEGIQLPPDVEILRVACHNFANFDVYDRLHIRIRNVGAIPTSSEGKNFVNVLILGIDSMSRLSFIRLLPLTYRFLTQDLKMTILRGMNKVGDNTYPNLIGLLTGKQAYGGKLPESSSGYDEWPLIWKNFSRLGYATLWAEDMPDFGLFNYLAEGFREAPALHYLRPFWLAMKDSPLLKVSSHMCYGTTPKHVFQMDYFKQFISWYGSRGTPHFGFSFVAEISHDYVSRVSSADAHFRDFLHWLADTGQLDNTLLFVMSDHGHRFDVIRTTKVGHIEERTPFHAIRIPMTLTSRQPKILDNILLNRGRLVTPYDVHATLSDLLEFVISGRPLGQSPPPEDTLGLSLFGPIPANRSCKEASIPAHYCVCETASAIDVSDNRAATAALATVQYINDLLKDVTDKCSPLTLSTIKTSQLVKTMEDNDASESQKVRVVIEVQPSEALFEATVVVRGETGVVWGEVSRINPYAGQSDCIRHAILRKFCFCTELPDPILGADSVKL